MNVSAEVNDCDTFVSLWNNMKDFIDEANVELIKTPDENYLRIIFVDNTKNIFSVTKFNSILHTDIDSFTYSFGMNMAQYYSLVNISGRDDKLYLTVDPINNKLLITSINALMNSTTKSELNLISVNQNSQIPDFAYNSKIIMRSGDFYKICRHLNGLSNIVQIVCTNNSFKFLSSNDYLNKELTIGPSDNCTIETLEDCKISIDLEKILLFQNYSNVSYYIELYLHDQNCLYIKHFVGELGEILVGINKN